MSIIWKRLISLILSLFRPLLKKKILIKIALILYVQNYNVKKCQDNRRENVIVENCLIDYI